jgi:hypothetical protein
VLRSTKHWSRGLQMREIWTLQRVSPGSKVSTHCRDSRCYRMQQVLDSKREVLSETVVPVNEPTLPLQPGQPLGELHLRRMRLAARLPDVGGFGDPFDRLGRQGHSGAQRRAGPAQTQYLVSGPSALKAVLLSPRKADSSDNSPAKRTYRSQRFRPPMRWKIPGIKNRPGLGTERARNRRDRANEFVGPCAGAVGRIANGGRRALCSRSRAHQAKWRSVA